MAIPRSDGFIAPRIPTLAVTCSPWMARRWCAVLTASPSSMPSTGVAEASDAILFAFDLIELDGEDFRPLPFAKRKARLARLLTSVPADKAFFEAKV
jgi:ATP-dependent DNA ligase